MAAKRPKTTPPAALHGEALALHDRLLSEYDFSDDASLTMLRELCGTLSRLREVQAVIGSEGLTVEGSAGQLRPHPLLATEDMLRRSLLAHARSLRLTVEA
jgi:phage terminase small subunit